MLHKLHRCWVCKKCVKLCSCSGAATVRSGNTRLLVSRLVSADKSQTVSCQQFKSQLRGFNHLMEDVYVSREASRTTWLAKLASSWYHLMSQSLKLGLLQQLQAASAVWKMWLITLRWSLRQVVCISTVASNVRLEFRDIWREIQIIKHHDDRPSQKQTLGWLWLWNFVFMGFLGGFFKILFSCLG